MLLSNKGLLPVLWELFPNHPNLLPAYFERYKISGDFVQKPLLSREGANVAIYRGGEVIREGGTYGEEGYIYQAYAEVPKFGDSYTTIGSWIVGDQAAGIGIREDATPITCNTSHFVPHYFI
jgi:glutathionylspermidine synthase